MIEDSEGFKRTQRRYINQKNNKKSYTYWHECNLGYTRSIVVIINDLFEEWEIFDRLGRKVYRLISRSVK